MKYKDMSKQEKSVFKALNLLNSKVACEFKLKKFSGFLSFLLNEKIDPNNLKNIKLYIVSPENQHGKSYDFAKLIELFNEFYN